MPHFKNDTEMFSFIREKLYVAVVCDVLDELGYWNQAMHHRLRPILPDIHNCGFVGRARTFDWLETDKINEENPYGFEIEAVDSLNEGDVAVHSTDYNGTNAPWGELMSTIAKRKGVSGCIVDSQIRDCTKIVEMNFPVYYAGIRPLNSKGRGIVVGYDNPIKCGDVTVNAGDLIFADFDGIVVIPKAVEELTLIMAAEKVNNEDCTRDELRAGVSLREVYDKYKAL
jgi:regulator of RNase E activity RraA